MTKMTIALVTGNKNKAAEVASIIEWPIEAIKLEIKEIQSLNVEMVAREKAATAYSMLRRPVIVDDTGMEIAALGHLPGALVSWFLDSIGPEGILRMLRDGDDRSASVSTCIAYVDDCGIQTFVGRLDGRLSERPRGNNGFGYDSIFIPRGHEQTFAEMSEDQKNAISMRRQALVQVKEYLDRAMEATA